MLSLLFLALSLCLASAQRQHRQPQTQKPHPHRQTPPLGKQNQAIRARFDELIARQSRVAAVLGGSQFRGRLEEAVGAADAESSAVSDAFLSGSLPLDLFVDRYVDARAAHHALDLKRQAAEQVLPAS